MCYVPGMKRASDPVSASELKAYLQCPRVWAAKYRWDAWPRVEKPALRAAFAIGKDFHKLIEDYVRTGVTPDPAHVLYEMFMSALPYLPAPGSAWVQEQRHDFVYEGIPFQATPDYVGPVLRGSETQVQDFKTSRNPRAYGLLTKDQKLVDAQTLVYAHKFMAEGGIFNHLYTLKNRAVEHAYGNTDSKAPLRAVTTPTPTYLSAEGIATGMRETVLPAASAVWTMRNKYARINPLALTGDRLGCKMFGGCEHLSQCFPFGDFGGMSADSFACMDGTDNLTEDQMQKWRVVEPTLKLDDVLAGAVLAGAAPDGISGPTDGAQEPSGIAPASFQASAPVVMPVPKPEQIQAPRWVPRTSKTREPVHAPSPAPAPVYVPGFDPRTLTQDGAQELAKEREAALAPALVAQHILWQEKLSAAKTLAADLMGRLTELEILHKGQGQ